MGKAGDVYAFGKLLCYMHGNGVILPPTLQARSWWKAKKGVDVIPDEMPLAIQVGFLPILLSRSMLVLN